MAGARKEQRATSTGRMRAPSRGRSASTSRKMDLKLKLIRWGIALAVHENLHAIAQKHVACVALPTCDPFLHH